MAGFDALVVEHTQRSTGHDVACIAILSNLDLQPLFRPYGALKREPVAPALR